MATASSPFKSRTDYRKQMELSEERKAGLAPAEVDKNGKVINPHIPEFLASAPWYLKQNGLDHQKREKLEPNLANAPWYSRGARGRKASKYQDGACTNCGARTHTFKSCMERPREVGAKFTGKHIAADEIIEKIELGFDAKRDRWNGFDTETYLKVQKLKRVENDMTKVDESAQTDFARVTKRVRTTDGGCTGTVRNLRIREDTAKYLLNLDVDSAYYDPKTRSMRADPLPDADPSEKFYAGDNQNRITGEALEFRQMVLHAWEAQAAPSQAEACFKNFKVVKERMKARVNKSIVDKYGNAATENEICHRNPYFPSIQEIDRSVIEIV